jgi:HlyD family secretion protein
MNFMTPLFSWPNSIGRAKILKAVAMVSAIVLTSSVALRWWLGPILQVESIERRDFVQTIVASGHVESPHRVEIGVQLTGTVKKIPVKEGQSVQAQQVLIELESSELIAALKQAELSVTQAENKIRQLKEIQAPVLEQAYQQALVTQSTTLNSLNRTQDLFSKGFTGQAALDEAKRIALIAESQVQSYRAQLAGVQEGGSDFVSALTNLSQSHANVDLAKARLRYAQVNAPLAGTLISRNVEAGDVVQPGKVLMVLSPTGSTELVAQIDEKHLSQLKVGQVATVSADAYSTQTFPATVAFINPGVDVQRGSVTVKLNIPDIPTYLQQDMTVSLNIETAKRSQAILVSLEAVHDIDKSPWVLLVHDGKTQRKVIRLGLRGTGWCEVLSGLEAGDKVIHDALFLQDDARVRIK